jgi:hypothetical protein
MNKVFFLGHIVIKNFFYIGESRVLIGGKSDPLGLFAWSGCVKLIGPVFFFCLWIFAEPFVLPGSLIPSVFHFRGLRVRTKLGFLR